MITRRDIIMVAIAAFLFGGTAGLFAGTVGMRVLMNVGMHVMHRVNPWDSHAGPPWGPHPGSPDGPPGPPAVLHRLERVLELTPAQRESIGVVLERSRGRMDALRDSLDAEIEARLTPPQRAEWRLMQRHHPPRGENWPHHR